MFKTETWNGVPDGSLLHVSFTHTAAFGLNGTHLIDGGPGTPLLKADLQSAHFPLTIHVGSGQSHIVKFDVSFVGQACTFRVEARVVTPAGDTFAQPFGEQHTLANGGEPFTIKLFANG